MNVRSFKEYKQTVIHQAIVCDNFPMMKMYMLLAHITDPYILFVDILCPILNKPSVAWDVDCLDMAKVFKIDEVYVCDFRSSRYKVGPFIVVLWIFFRSLFFD